MTDAAMTPTPRTAAGRALHDWWHQIGLLMLDAAQEHEHPVGCNFLPMVLAIEAQAAPPDALREARPDTWRLLFDLWEYVEGRDSEYGLGWPALRSRLGTTVAALYADYNATFPDALTPASPSAAPLDVERLARAYHSTVHGGGFDLDVCLRAAEDRATAKMLVRRYEIAAAYDREAGAE